MTATQIFRHLKSGGTVTTLDSYTDKYPSYCLVDGALCYRLVHGSLIAQPAEHRTGYKPDGFWTSAEQFARAVARFLSDDKIVLG